MDEKMELEDEILNQACCSTAQGAEERSLGPALSEEVSKASFLGK
jgi:hypothetical protein